MEIKFTEHMKAELFQNTLCEYFDNNFTKIFIDNANFYKPDPSA